jgi:hypothetical protein
MAVTTGLVQGPARIYVAAPGTALPTDADVAALKAGTFPGFEFVGRTTEAVTLTDTPELVEATSQQTSRAIDYAIVSWETTVETTVRDVTLANIVKLMHGLQSGDTALPGVAGPTAKLSFAIVGPWDGGESMIVIERGVLENGLELAFNKEEFSTLPMTIKVLEGDQLPAGYEISVIVGGGDTDE